MKFILLIGSLIALVVVSLTCKVDATKDQTDKSIEDLRLLLFYKKYRAMKPDVTYGKLWDLYNLLNTKPEGEKLKEDIKSFIEMRNISASCDPKIAERILDTIRLAGSSDYKSASMEDYWKTNAKRLFNVCSMRFSAEMKTAIGELNKSNNGVLMNYFRKNVAKRYQFEYPYSSVGRVRRELAAFVESRLVGTRLERRKATDGEDDYANRLEEQIREPIANFCAPIIKEFEFFLPFYGIMREYPTLLYRHFYNYERKWLDAWSLCRSITEWTKTAAREIGNAIQEKRNKKSLGVSVVISYGNHEDD